MDLHRGRALRLPQIMKKRSFLWQLLITALVAACIPLSIVAVSLVTTSGEHVYEMSDIRLRNAANSAASRFDGFVGRMYETAQRMNMSVKLYDSVLETSVSAEMEALEMIRYYGISLPFVDNVAILLSDGDLYTNDGKMKINGYCAYELKMSESEFQEALEALDGQRGFIPWEKSKGNLLYVTPLRVGSARRVSRYAIFRISPTTFRENLETALSEEYDIFDIRDGNDAVVYKNARFEQADATPDQWLSVTICSSDSFMVTVYTDQSALHESMSQLTRHARLLSGVCLCLCVLLVVGAAFFNYRPLLRLLKSVRGGSGESGDVSEFEAIAASYNGLVSEKGTLTCRLYETNMIIADRVMEDLLNGRRVSSDDMSFLKLNSRYYRVVCAPLDQISCVTSIIERNSIGAPIYAIEMYHDNCLAFVCGCPDDSETSVRALSAALRKLIRSETAPLGFSRALDRPERMVMAYLEAGRALLRSADACDRFASDLSPQPMFMLDRNDESVEMLICAVKNGDEYMITYAKEFFEAVSRRCATRAAQRYSCYQLVDLYRSLCQSMGRELDVEQLSTILQESSMTVLRERILEAFEKIRSEIRAEIESAEDATDSALVRYIDENFTNPLFDMNDVASHMGVSIYTASRILKKQTGVGFRKYLNDLRMEYACRLLLTTSLSVNDISERAGFTSPSYFISIFKKTEAETPGGFRRARGVE